MTSKEDIMFVATKVMRRSLIAQDMRTLGRSLGEFYLELVTTLSDGGMNTEDASTDAFSLTSNLMSEFISIGLHLESQEGDDENEERVSAT